jgi:hypothetical protein
MARGWCASSGARCHPAPPSRWSRPCVPCRVARTSSHARPTRRDPWCGRTDGRGPRSAPESWPVTVGVARAALARSWSTTSSPATTAARMTCRTSAPCAMRATARRIPAGTTERAPAAPTGWGHTRAPDAGSRETPALAVCTDSWEPARPKCGHEPGRIVGRRTARHGADYARWRRLARHGVRQLEEARRAADDAPARGARSVEGARLLAMPGLCRPAPAPRVSAPARRVDAREANGRGKTRAGRTERRTRPGCGHDGGVNPSRSYAAS